MKNKKTTKPAAKPAAKTLTKSITKPANDIPESFLFLSTKEMTVRELMEAIKADFDYEIEIWDDAGILEIIVEEKASIDIEEFSINPRDEQLLELANKADAKSTFCFAAPVEIFEVTKKILLNLKDSFGGIVVGDTADLKPEL